MTTNLINGYNPNPFKGQELTFNLVMLGIAAIIYFFGIVPDRKLSTWEYEKVGLWWAFAVPFILIVLNFIRVRLKNAKP